MKGFIIGITISVLYFAITAYIDKKSRIPFFKENSSPECGPRCLQMIFKFYKKNVEFDAIAAQTNMNNFEGTSLLDLERSADINGFKSLVIKLPYEGIDDNPSLLNIPLPCIAYWQNNYFIIIEDISNKYCEVIHPAKGRMKLNRESFVNNWRQENSDKGIVMLLEKL